MKKLLLLGLLVCAFFKADAQHYNQYCNSIYSFCLEIPGDFVRLGDSKTGTGQYFKDEYGSQITVYATANQSEETLKQRFDREMAALSGKKLPKNKLKPVIEVAEMNDSCYTLIYRRNGFQENVYRRLENKCWKNVELVCPEGTPKAYGYEVKRMIASLK